MKNKGLLISITASVCAFIIGAVASGIIISNTAPAIPEPRSISVNAESTTNDSDNYPTYTVTADVELSEGETLDWLVVWADDKNSANVNEYVTVTGTGATATIKCVKAFEGNIYVKALRKNGTYGSCVVSFVGKPSEIKLSPNNLTLNAAGSYVVSALGTSYTIDLSLSNVFNKVGDKFGAYEIEIQKYGTVNVTTTNTKIADGTVISTTTSDISFAQLGEATPLIDVSLVDDAIKLDVKKSLSGYAYTSIINGEPNELGIAMPYSNRVQKYNSCVTECGYMVIVTETVSGISTAFTVTWADSLL